MTLNLFLERGSHYSLHITLISFCMSVYCQQTTMTQRESEGDNIVSTVPSWSAGLARVGGFYQDGDWYNVNISRWENAIQDYHHYWYSDSEGCPWCLKWSLSWFMPCHLLGMQEFSTSCVNVCSQIKLFTEHSYSRKWSTLNWSEKILPKL